MVKIPTILVEKTSQKVLENQMFYEQTQHVWLYRIYKNWLNFNFFCIFLVIEYYNDEYYKSCSNIF